MKYWGNERLLAEEIILKHKNNTHEEQWIIKKTEDKKGTQGR